MNWLTLLLLAAAASTAFLIAAAVAAQIYLLPQPRRFGFEVRDED